MNLRLDEPSSDVHQPEKVSNTIDNSNLDIKNDLFKNNVVQENNRLFYHGYSVVKEFYSPDYSVDTTIKKGFDRRITLHWNPNIVVSGIDPTVPIIFYNNDRTQRFKIIVEGFTTSGKMVYIEKTYDADNTKRSF